MIKENRWQHIIGVARKAEEFALKLRPDDSKFSEDMFLLGLLHDVGYEFIDSNSAHAAVGGGVLKRNNYKYWREVALHGDETVENMSDELFILNCADKSTGPNGEEFTFDERLAELASRYGKDSDLYKKRAMEIEKLKNDKRYSKIFGQLSVYKMTDRSR